MKWSRRAFWAIAFLSGAATAANGASLLKPDDAAVVGQGKQVYAEQCASCHGDNLEGEANWKVRKPDGKMPAPPHDQSGHTWHHAENVLFELTKFGLKKFAGEGYQTDMPAYEGMLTDEEIVAVLSFIKSTWPSEIRRHHDEISSAGD